MKRAYRVKLEVGIDQLLESEIFVEAEDITEAIKVAENDFERVKSSISFEQIKITDIEAFEVKEVE
jgi:hypothetical protein